MNFKDIIGQKELITNLKYVLLSGRIGHAYIFSGPAGTGKKMVASIVAGFLICDNPGPDGPCGVCQACLLYEGGTNPDFRSVRTEEASIGVDEIREIQGDVTIRPMYSKRKVYLIEDADKMTVQAQNCLLKTLEEPPPYVVIILTASNHKALLETVRSRSQRIHFKKYTGEEVRQAVIRRFGEGHPGIDLAVRYGDGVIGAALELAGNSRFAALREDVLGMVADLPKPRYSDIFSLTAFFEENRDYTDFILDTMLFYYRDLLVIKVTGNEKMLINPDKKDIILNNARKFSLQSIAANIEQVEFARRALKQNANFQLVLENLLIKLQGE